MNTDQAASSGVGPRMGMDNGEVSARPNILLVILDSVRARNTSLHGHENQTTPELAKLSSELTVFTQARAPSIHSIASHVSIFTGLETEAHNITQHESYIEEGECIWPFLSDSGYETGIFTPNSIVVEASNLGQSFDTEVGPERTLLFRDAFSPREITGSVSPDKYLKTALRSDTPIRGILNGLYYRYSDWGSQNPHKEDAEHYIDEFLSWTDGTRKPWAACLNLMDAHSPYVPDPEHDKWGGEQIQQLRDSVTDLGAQVSDTPVGYFRAMESLYDGCIRQLDAAVGELIEELKARGVFDDLLLIVTSDHGEAFGERSKLTPEVRLKGHRWGIDETLTHVPLLIKAPGQTSGRTVENLATLTKTPAVIGAALQGRDCWNEYLPDNGSVVSSTFRVRPPGDELPFRPEKRQNHFGPWRALYRHEDGVIRKYATRNDDHVVVTIRDAQTEYEIDRENTELVDQAFDQLPLVDIEMGDAEEREIRGDVEERLEHLGYLR